ncbi:hypothetical protein [Natronosalvus amylolyticus]|uniref:hypothetical protein n=1 Tax=Natronosalvus amylolyticus TaxID=2961994 RepID=UPI0020C9AA06|nr:hypothetical protein [Natronosalvus amylolyticus]
MKMLSVETVNDLPIWSDGPRLETPTLERPGTRYVLAGAGVWAFVLASVFADLYTTAYGLEMGARETNDVAVMVLEGYGLYGLAVLKAAITGVVAALSVALYAVGDPYRSSLWMPMLAGLLWLAAGLWNAYQIVGVQGVVL